MEIHRKDMARNNWGRVRRSTTAYRLVDEPGFSGMAGLMHMLEVEKPLVFDYEGEKITAVDNGFYWLQMAPKDGNWWLTVMFDREEQPRQAYFDITGENHILPDGASWFTDLFLDVVVMPDGRAMLLDQDELEQALAEGVVSQQQYDAACGQAKALLDGLSGRAAEFFAWAARHFQALKPLLG